MNFNINSLYCLQKLSQKHEKQNIEVMFTTKHVFHSLAHSILFCLLGHYISNQGQICFPEKRNTYYRKIYLKTIFHKTKFKNYIIFVNIYLTFKMRNSYLFLRAPYIKTFP